MLIYDSEETRGLMTIYLMWRHAGLKRKCVSELIERLHRDQSQRYSRSAFIRMLSVLKSSLSPIQADELLNIWDEFTDEAYYLTQGLMCQNITVMTLWDKQYPYLLKQISAAPLFLFVKGNLRILNPIENTSAKVLAVVGSRKLTDYGERFISTELRSLFSDYPLAFCSGFARGCDIKATLVAYKSEAQIISCMAHGLDFCYPAEHRHYMEELLESGRAVFVSEHAIDTKPLKAYFPARNRIISGLSNAVLIIEAGLRSGSLITAEFAGLQGRDVMAVPGSVFAANSVGCNNLIKDGAFPACHCGDIVQTLGLTVKQSLANGNKRNPLLKPLEEQSLTEEQWACALGISLKALRISRLNCELRGEIAQLNGKWFLTTGNGTCI